MPWTRDTIAVITNRIEKGIESRLTGSISLLRRAVLRILARVFSGAVHGNYGHVAWVAKQLFILTADREALIRTGREYGLSPFPGSFATGQVTFTGTDTTVIPIDTRIQNEDGIEYGTLAAGTITGGVATVNIQSVEATEDANHDLTATFFLQLISAISGIDNDVELITDLTGGIEEESTEAFRERLLVRRRNPPMGGNDNDYEVWAKEVPGVGRAWTFPLAFGLGTLAVVIKSTDTVDPTPSAQLLSDVAGHIDTVRPTTADVTIQSIQDSADVNGFVDFSFTCVLTPNDAVFRDAITENINNLFETHTPGEDIKLSQILGAFSSSGVTDYEITVWSLDAVVQPLNQDLSLANFQYPKLVTATFV